MCAADVGVSERLMIIDGDPRPALTAVLSHPEMGSAPLRGWPVIVTENTADSLPAANGATRSLHAVGLD